MPTALLPSRAVVKVTGSDAASFLQGLVTQDIDAARDGAAFGALLTPQGKILADFLIVRSDDGYLFDCDAATAQDLVKRLNLYRLRAHVAIERLGDFAVGATWGADMPVLNSPGLISFSDPRLPALGGRIVGPAAAVSAMTNAVGGPTDEAEYDRHRRALGVPQIGKDFGADEVFPLDVNYDALNGVSYKKGCFVGQEVTSRMKRKGEIRKRTMIARFAGAPPQKGAPVMAGASTLGEILSGAEGLALALLRLDRLAAARAAATPSSADGKEVRIDAPDWLN